MHSSMRMRSFQVVTRSAIEQVLLSWKSVRSSRALLLCLCRVIPDSVLRACFIVLSVWIDLTDRKPNVEIIVTTSDFNSWWLLQLHRDAQNSHCSFVHIFIVRTLIFSCNITIPSPVLCNGSDIRSHVCNCLSTTYSTRNSRKKCARSWPNQGFTFLCWLPLFINVSNL